MTTSSARHSSHIRHGIRQSVYPARHDRGIGAISGLGTERDLARSDLAKVGHAAAVAHGARGEALDYVCGVGACVGFALGRWGKGGWWREEV